MNLVIEYQYFAPSILFKELSSIIHLGFEGYENFQKRGFRNRLVIAGADGPIALTVPLLKGRNQKSLTKDVMIDHRAGWQALHWKTIVTCYNRSPWFEFYRDDLSELYRKSFGHLIEWNDACLKWILGKLYFDLSVSMTDHWIQQYDRDQWSDWRNKLTPNSIQHVFPHPPRYMQVFSERTGFIPHLSILDLLFCEGTNARKILNLPLNIS